MMNRGLVLIADDDLDTRAAASELLVDLDYWPVTARNGLEALEVLRQNAARPTALLVDLYMPLMDGEALCAALDDDPELARIPRVLISANDHAATRVERCGAATFLSKPVTPEALLRALEHATRP